MNTLNFSENIIRLRHKKKITQEQLAEFVGVTKASVSKWETRQSIPDVLMLPQLAAFFDVTIDELLGYEPQLSKEQIQKIYHALAADFAVMPFEDAMIKTQTYVKKYYSCYPFLFQICSLWLNHFMLADSQMRQREILTEASDLCCHIIEDCKDIGICNDSVILKACIDLQLGKAGEVVETLENILNPYRLLTQSDSVLIQAYMLADKKENADSFTQMSMFLHLNNLVADATQYLAIHSDDFSICEETIQRIRNVMSAYQLEHLHPNTAALFEYQAAIIYCMHNKKKYALRMLQQYVDNIVYALTDHNLAHHGDGYFNRLQNWYEQLDIGAEAPRHKRVILDSFIQSMNHPVFAALEGEEEYQRLKQSITERSGKI